MTTNEQIEKIARECVRNIREMENDENDPFADSYKYPSEHAATIVLSAARRIAALSAQVAELSKQVDNWREIHEIIVRTEETRLARIAELERDKARMCDALELARQNLPDRLIFHIDAAMNPKQP